MPKFNVRLEVNVSGPDIETIAEAIEQATIEIDNDEVEIDHETIRVHQDDSIELQKE